MSDRIAVMNEGVIEQVGDGRTIYDQPATAFVASFVGENNPFDGQVAEADGEFAVIETIMGRFRGRNRSGAKVGDAAVMFVRPESFKLGAGATDATIESTVLNVAFEGNLSHVFLKGPTKKEIVLTVGRGVSELPGQGDTARISFDPRAALILPQGKLASE